MPVESTAFRWTLTSNAPLVLGDPINITRNKCADSELLLMFGLPPLHRWLTNNIEQKFYKSLRPYDVERNVYSMGDRLVIPGVVYLIFFFFTTCFYTYSRSDILV